MSRRWPGPPEHGAAPAGPSLSLRPRPQARSLSSLPGPPARSVSSPSRARPSAAGRAPVLRLAARPSCGWPRRATGQADLVGYGG